MMYVIIDLGSVFLMSMLVEWLSHTRFVVDHPESNDDNNNKNVVAGLIQTGLYGIRITLAYLVMLQVMLSFDDVWILIVAVAGYSLGFLIFGSRVVGDDDDGNNKHKHERGLLLFYQKKPTHPTDLPPLNC